MSLIEIEFVDASPLSGSIKKELKTEYIDNNDNKMNENISDNTIICGNIIATDNMHFSLLCFSCNNSFLTLELFKEHMKEKHFKNKFNSDQDKTTNNCVNSNKMTILNGKNNLIFHDAEKANSENTNEIYFKEYFDENSYDSSKEEDCKIVPEDVTKITVTEQKESLACSLCNNKFETNIGLNRHFLTHTKKNKFPSSHKCKYCGKEFSSGTKLKIHERIHTGEKPYQCDLCGKPFRTKNLLKNHMPTHTGERPYKCNFCPSAFSHRMNLIIHVRGHMGDKRFQCEICDKKFLRNVEKRIHMRTHTGEKPYQCEFCGAHFSTSSKLTNHIKRHTNNKPHKCDLCFKSFYTLALLKNHLVVHSTERPFECQICYSNFPRKRALNTHMKIHSDIKEYICKICGKGFAQNAGLYCHMKTHGLSNSIKTEAVDNCEQNNVQFSVEYLDYKPLVDDLQTLYESNQEWDE